MNGNTPYAGRRDVTGAGQRMPDDVPTMPPDRRRALSASVARIAARTRTFLPEEYAVGSEVSQGINGPRATVAVRPPVGHPVSADFELSPDDDEEIAAEDREEVARGLAASAALQVKQALGGEDITPTAR